jgi:hypothetical protein
VDDEPLYPECHYCGEPILPWEDQRDTNEGACGFHADCLLRLAIGSLAHLQGRCHCYGGTDSDPPEMTLREAATAAADYYRSMHRA